MASRTSEYTYVCSDGYIRHQRYTRTLKRLTQEQMDEVIERYRGGESARKLGPQYGVSDVTVYKIIHGTYKPAAVATH